MTIVTMLLLIWLLINCLCTIILRKCLECYTVNGYFGSDVRLVLHSPMALLGMAIKEAPDLWGSLGFSFQIMSSECIPLFRKIIVHRQLINNHINNNKITVVISVVYRL